MATQQVVPGGTQAQAAGRLSARKLPPKLANPPGGLYPMMSAAFEIDEYRVLAGWPVPVPDYDVRVKVLVSGDGTLLADRDSPLAIYTGATYRWVADPSFWDVTTLQWLPAQGSGPVWQGSPGTDPTLFTDYEYNIGDERFIEMCALNFDSNTGDYLSCDFTSFFGGTSGYTVIMVVNPNSLYGNDQTIDTNALWCPASTDGNWMSFGVRGQSIWMTTESQRAQRGVDLGNYLTSTAPAYLAFVVGRPQTTLYAAPGPGNILSRGLAAGDSPVPLVTDFWLGKSTQANWGTADMALLDLGVYPSLLKRNDILTEFAKLAAAYGGNK